MSIKEDYYDMLCDKVQDIIDFIDENTVELSDEEFNDLVELIAKINTKLEKVNKK